MENLRTIIVTGSNKGIGYYILKRLAEENKTFQFIMAVRSISNGENALASLSKTIPEVEKRIKIEQLDVADSGSIDKFVSNIKEKFGKVDALINNAGFAFKGDAFGPEVVRDTFQPNFYGTIELSEKMIDYIKDYGKIITVGSQAGKLRILKDDNLVKSFTDPNITKTQLYGLAKQFYDSVVDDTYAQKGFPKQSYAMSKLCLNTFMTSIFPKEKKIIDKNIQVYCLCPGWCRTDMAGDKAPKSAEDGADTPVYLVNLPWEVNKDLQGKFFYERQVTSL